jgi:microcystin-dependent protein
MVNSFTSGKGRLVQPPFGSYVDEWQRPVNSDFGLVDALISGTTTLNVSTLTPSTPFFTLVFQDFDTSQTPWLNPLAGQNMRVAITGALAFNVTIFIPANFPGMWIFDNQTTGPFTVTVVTNAVGSSGVSLAQGYMTLVFCDGTNVRYADQGNVVSNQGQGMPTGAITAFGGPNIPAGYLYCNGAAVSRTTYSGLFSAIGTTWGGGDGTTTFNLPDLQNMFLRGVGGAGLGTLENDTFGSHNHTSNVNDPGHQHTTVILADSGSTGSGQNVTGVTGNVYRTQGGSLTTINNTGISVSVGLSGGSETRPVNKRVNYIIKT